RWPRPVSNDHRGLVSGLHLDRGGQAIAGLTAGHFPGGALTWPLERFRWAVMMSTQRSLLRLPGRTWPQGVTHEDGSLGAVGPGATLDCWAPGLGGRAWGQALGCAGWRQRLRQSQTEQTVLGGQRRHRVGLSAARLRLRGGPADRPVRPTR